MATPRTNSTAPRMNAFFMVPQLSLDGRIGDVLKLVRIWCFDSLHYLSPRFYRFTLHFPDLIFSGLVDYLLHRQHVNCLSATTHCT